MHLGEEQELGWSSTPDRVKNGLRLNNGCGIVSIKQMKIVGVRVTRGVAFMGAAFSTLFFSGCETNTNTTRGAATGALIGSVIGGVIGHQSDEQNEGVLLGATLGAAIGGAVGNEKDRKEEEKQMEEMAQQEQRIRQAELEAKRENARQIAAGAKVETAPAAESPATATPVAAALEKEPETLEEKQRRVRLLETEIADLDSQIESENEKRVEAEIAELEARLEALKRQQVAEPVRPE